MESGVSLSYTSFLQRIDCVKEILASVQGDKPEVFSIEEHLTADSLAAILALAELRQIVLPQHPDLNQAESEEQRQIAGARWRLQNREVKEIKAERSEKHALIEKLAAEKHAGLILFSSGTSGRPKGMLHDFEHLLERYKNVREREDIPLQLLLTDHIGGLDAALRTLLSGSTLVIPDARTPVEAGRAIARHGVTVLPASPTFLNLMLMTGVAQNYNIASLKVIAYGAESMPAGLLKKLAEAFPGVDLQQKFGTSETGAIRIKSKASGKLEFAIEDTDWKIVNGELWLKSSSRILGYLNPGADSSALLSNGWYRTGDLAEHCGNGGLRLCGRISDFINVGGQKVHPSEIEAVIGEMDAVEDCRVYAREDPITGHAIACSLRTEAEGGPLDWKRRIRSFCRGRLAPWKIPSTVCLNNDIKINSRLKRIPASDT